jgi:hypothetical protein
MTQLGIDYSLIVGKTEMVPLLVKHLTMARWGKTVKKLGVSPKGNKNPNFSSNII